MIRLKKQPAPQILLDNANEWSKALMRHIRAGTNAPDSLKRKYNQDSIKTILKQETHHKCMYCESIANHVTYEHIEHIKPKAKDKFPELTYTWSNLGWACPKCNMNKSDTYDIHFPFIDPYHEELSDHIWASGAIIRHLPGKQRGEITIKVIQLNRPELLEKRRERMDQVQTIADNYTSTTSPLLKKLLQKELEEEFQNDKEYALCVNSMKEFIFGPTN